MKTKEMRIEELKHAMEIEQANGFPNGDLWNKMASELDDLERVPNVFEMLSIILNSPREY